MHIFAASRDGQKLKVLQEANNVIALPSVSA
jgi:hypothetical protein